jgi:hypothetical protein
MAENKNRQPAPHDADPTRSDPGPVFDPQHPESPYERRDVDVWVVGKFGIALALLCVVCLALLFGLFRFFEARNGGPKPRFEQSVGIDASKLPPEPRLEESPILDLQRMRAAEDQVLNSYAWIDKQNGIVRIPISQAMDLLVQRGLPARQQAGPQSAASGVSVPTESGLGPKVQQAGGPLAGEGK